VTACPELTALADVVRGFAQLMADRRGADLDGWIAQVRNAELVELEPFLAGLEQDHDAAIAGLPEPYSNGSIEGINTKPS
jgi:transposase